ncbi:MAG: hypothetical protein HOI95_27460 [Chromatiales bacterium]|jgi:hypothetical protein|nr:hypothetical protein [Chromatiales bacterium]
MTRRHKLLQRHLALTVTMVAALLCGLRTSVADMVEEDTTPPPDASAAQFVSDATYVMEQTERLVDAILGPDARSGATKLPPLPADASCEVLYRRVSVLMPQSRRTRGSMYEDPASKMFAGLGVRITPAFHLLVLPEYARISEGSHVDKVNREISALRQQLASKLCFVR